MILTRIDIENFKQYQGEHSIDVPEQATVGVIGENGAGKTTLFEALEWCLYSPRNLSATDIRPRHATGHTTVRVYLESNDRREQYIVERILRRTPVATVYRMDVDGNVETVVQGPRQVSDYVSTKLIGLGHTAFTATFFTRQKELHLFGDQAPGKRREEVGRLMGLETIRHAQRNIVQERSQARADARALKLQYERESDSRDLRTELAQSEDAISSLTAKRLATTTAMTAAVDARTVAEQANHQALQRRDQDTQLAHLLQSARQELAGSVQQQKQIEAELLRLNHREGERRTLLAEAARLPGLRQQVAAMEAQRTRHQRRAELDRSIHDATQRQRDGNATVRDLVNGVHLAHRVDGWLWSPDDMVSVQPGLQRLLAVASTADVEGAEASVAAFQHVLDTERRHTGERQKLEQYRQRQQALKDQERDFLLQGDPRDQITRIDAERETLLHKRTTLDATRTTAEGERDRTRKILGNLEGQQVDGDCPTCGRPFSHEDAALVMDTLRARISQLDVDITDRVSQAQQATADLAALEGVRQDVFTRIEALERIRTSLDKSVAFLESQQDATDEARSALETALRSVGLSEPPTADHIGEAQRIARQMRDLRGTRTTLQSCATTFAGIEIQLAAATTERVTLADVTFDPDAFQRAREEYAVADRAEAALQTIQSELARRPELEQDKARLEQVLHAAAARVTEHEGARKLLAYDPSEYETARTGLNAALDAERLAVTVVHQTEAELREAEHRRNGVLQEQKRLEQLALQSDASQSQADTLDLMAKEFTEFERYAAARKLPILADLTSQLVESITNGRYDRVEFDQDFGIVVFDGGSSDASYPISSFSGGERDAIILAARVALSHMIGRQATNPPGFLVLDEVFGSLDAARRHQLMDTLGTITRSFDELRQIFIISHVDDVRASPVLDELWRIQESPGGGSSITSLPPGSEIDAL